MPVSESAEQLGVAVDELDTRVLNAMQREFPLARRPFAVLAAELGTTPEEVLARVQRMCGGHRPVVRQISAIFDTRRLGYDSMLVAFRLDDAALPAAAAELNRDPGISHNYRRSGAFNLWFTIAVPPDAALSLEEQVARLAWKVGAERYILLPTLRQYKIGVQLEMGQAASAEARSEAPLRVRGATRDEVAEVRAGGLPSEEDKRFIRVLQRQVPLVAEPYDVWARELATTPDAVIAAAERFIAEGRMRRFSAVLRHQKAGFVANGMGIWRVPAARREEVGERMASFRAVSHCYERPTYPHWPYSLFTMIHGQSEEQVHDVAATIARETGIAREDYDVLFSHEEFKKARVPYFVPEHAEWERMLIDTTADYPGPRT